MTFERISIFLLDRKDTNKNILLDKNDNMGCMMLGEGMEKTRPQKEQKDKSHKMKDKSHKMRGDRDDQGLILTPRQRQGRTKIEYQNTKNKRPRTTTVAKPSCQR